LGIGDFKFNFLNGDIRNIFNHLIDINIYLIIFLKETGKNLIEFCFYDKKFSYKNREIK
jgi:hypothetical protein